MSDDQVGSGKTFVSEALVWASGVIAAEDSIDLFQMSISLFLPLFSQHCHEAVVERQSVKTYFHSNDISLKSTCPLRH